MIHLHETASAGAATQFSRIRHKFRDWLAYKYAGVASDARIAPTYTYSFEKPGTAVHANWTVHVPPHLAAEFEVKLQQWVERVKGQLRPYDVSCQPVEAAFAKRLAKYIVKGTDPTYVDHFFLGDVHQPQGTVWGKRAGTSPAIGNTVRREANFKPPRRRYAGMYGEAPGTPSASSPVPV